MLKAVQQVNQSQIKLYLAKLTNSLGSLIDKRLTVWGLSFKPNTDDVRESRSLALAKRLAEAGSDVHVYDPIASVTVPELTSIRLCTRRLIGQKL